MKPFFTEQEKKLANSLSHSKLKANYEKSEKLLNKACKTGRIANIKKAMDVHHTLEYALLYKSYSKHKKKYPG